MFSSTRVASSSSVRRPESKDTNLKKRALLNTKFKTTSTKVKKTQSSVSLVSNKRDTLNLNVSGSNTNVLKAKVVNNVHDGLNLVCVSCGKDVFMLSHDKCVAHYDLSPNSRVKRALFTSHVAAKSSNLGATPVVVIQIVLWIVDSGCSKHMTGNLKLLRNFIVKFMGTICFRNDHFTAITGYGDYVQGNITICHVYYVEGLGHNLFLVGQFWMEILKFSPLNLGTINQLTKQDLVDGLPKFKYDKDHLCSACEQGNRKKATFSSKLVPSTKSKLELIHMDLCGPMRVESINGKRYILVIVDDYSRYTWVFFLHTKDETLEMIIKFITQIQWNLKVQIMMVCFDNRTEFKNDKLRSYEKIGIRPKTSIT
ncbi:retrovirus-related pol polyprotein from transposon TNT 1-94 [Tanacetum coccineum]